MRGRDRRLLRGPRPGPARAQVGTLDPTLGTGGVTLFPAIEADGKAVASGSVGGDAALFQFTADGTFDPTFDTSVLDAYALPNGTYFVRLEADGQVLTQWLTLLR